MMKFKLVSILSLILSSYQTLADFRTSNLVINQENDNHERYASGENSANIVAEYVEPRDIYTNPLFYGFFYGYNVSDSLHLISQKILAAAYDTVPAFKNFMDEAIYKANVTEDPFAYYEKPLDPETGRFDPYFHTTAKFCGRTNCTTYWNKAGKELGRDFDMHLVGLFFTTRTYGIRVKLTAEEQNIFEVDERRNSEQAAEEEILPRIIGNMTGNHLIDNNIVVQGTEYEGYYRRHHHEEVDSHYYSLYPGINFFPQPQDFHPTESRAHITYGCAPNITPEQTGYDLLEIIDLEISSHISHQDFTFGGGDIPISTLRQYGGSKEENDDTEIIFVIYPSEKMVTQATFSVYL